METKNLSKKIVSGFISLTFRRVALLAISFATINLFLARFLPVEIIGIFNIANSILAFFTFFSDIGLAAAVIQKKELSEDDVKTTFTIQEILAFIIALTVWFAAPFLANFYSLDSNSIGLIRALGIGFFLTSLKVIPAVLLERDLKFQPLVFVEIIETIVFNAILIALVLNGLKIESFSWAVIGRSTIGVVVIYVVAPWKISLGLSKTAAKTLLNFGIPFQANSILAMLKDRLVPLVIARMIGATGIGYITWAQNMAFLPLEIMNIVIRVTFPAYSRLQDDHQALKSLVEKSLFFTALFLYPLLFGLLAIAPSLIEHVVSSKWQPALPLIYLFGISTFWASLSTSFTNVLNAIGKIKTTLKLMVMWTLLTWILSPLLTLLYGYLGVGLASAIISFTSIIPIIIIKRTLDINILKSIGQPLISAIIMSVCVFFLSKIFIQSLFSLIIVVLIGGGIYGLLMLVFAREKTKVYLKGMLHVSS